MRAFACLALLALSACASVPPAGAPQIIRVPVRVFVPVPEERTAFCPWERDSPPSEVFARAAERRLCLERYEGQFRAIRKIQGGPVPDE